MTTKIVTEPGFYGGRFLKPGQRYEPGEVDLQNDSAVELSSLTKDQLLTEAERRGVAVDRNATKAEIISAIGAS